LGVRTSRWSKKLQGLWRKSDASNGRKGERTQGFGKLSGLAKCDKSFIVEVSPAGKRGDYAFRKLYFQGTATVLTKEVRPTGSKRPKTVWHGAEIRAGSRLRRGAPG